MAKRHLEHEVITYLTEQRSAVGARDISAHLNEPRTTVTRHLVRLAKAGTLIREGSGPSTVYRIPAAATPGKQATSSEVQGPKAGPAWGSAALTLRAQLELPIGLRQPVTYQRQFVDLYQPNQSSLLPADLASALHQQGRLQGQQPAGTYARRVLEQLLIDLSWYSSRLEGNRKSLLDTRELFLKGRSADNDIDSTMLLNHRDAIEFILDAAPTYGINVQVVRNIQSLLMNGLLANPAALGATRRRIVNIAGTAYVPSQVPVLLDEMLGAILEKARAIRNPVECAFFLWMNIAYLQPFEDGNRRTSRLSSNLPLLLGNCAPLSFLDVEPADYAMAMLGVYEKQDVSLAVDLFEWTYKRSITKYRTILESMGAPDPFRAKYRDQLGDAVRQIVATGVPLSTVVDGLAIPEADRTGFTELLRLELANLESYNCARYRLNIGRTEEWLAKGRPT
jgi:Fic family protein